MTMAVGEEKTKNHNTLKHFKMCRDFRAGLFLNPRFPHRVRGDNCFFVNVLGVFYIGNY